MENHRLTVVICTYNRHNILEICLSTIIKQILDRKNIDIIIIDNNSTDETKKIVQKYQRKYSFLKYFLEPEIGLSHARNRGYKEAQGSWIGYLDDDALVEKGFIEESLRTIQETEFDAFGGKITSWFKYGQPRWLSSNFESNIPPNTQLGAITPNHIYGGTMFIKKKILYEFNGFSSKFGMKGSTIGYGEETHLMERLQVAGYQLGINPYIIIKHLVPQKKLKMWWHIKAEYARGKTIIQLKKSPKIIYLLSFGILSKVKTGFKQLLNSENFYIENFFLLIIKHFAFTAGIVAHYYKNLNFIEAPFKR